LRSRKTMNSKQKKLFSSLIQKVIPKAGAAENRAAPQH